MSSDREYRSSLRAERAAETRLRIRRSARALFEEQGFAGTTVAQIADAAGVAAPTVYSTFGGKAGVVGAMLEDLAATADQPAWVQRVRAEQDPDRQLDLFVTWLRTMFESGAPILRAALAARSDPDVAAMRTRGDENRRRATTELTGAWARTGALRPGLEPEEAAHTLWLLTSVEQYLLATEDLGWSPDRYEQWLGSLARLALLGPRD